MTTQVSNGGPHLESTGARESLPERSRNELLRRVDWRFLLRLESNPTTLCLASGRLRGGVELMSSLCTREPHAQGGCDLAVAIDPGPRALRRARAALRPGGLLYTEWRTFAGGRRRVLGRLRRAGFVAETLYWPWPAPRRGPAHFWLPLDAPEAVDYFLSTRPVGSRAAFLRRLWRLADRFHFLVRLCAVAEKPGEDSDAAAAPSIEDVETVIRRGWSEWGFGREPARLSWLLVSAGFRSINKAVALVFADSAATPALIVKFGRVPEARPYLEQEAATLRLLETSRPNLPGVPRVLFAGDRAGMPALGETAMHGRPLSSVLAPDTFADAAEAVTGWLVELAGDARPVPREEWWARLVQEPLQLFEDRFRGVVTGDDLAAGRRLLASLGDLPLVCEHRDCAPWNILVTDGYRPAFLDWESSEPRGLPALDLVYFLTQAALVVEDALGSERATEAFARTLDPETATGRIVRRCEQQYAEALGLDPRMLGPLRVLCWIVHSRSDYRHLELEQPGPPDRALLGGTLFLSLWREELRRAAVAQTS